MPAALKFLLLLHALTVVFASATAEGYFEELLIRPMSSGNIAYHFQFTTQWDKSNSSKHAEHFKIFPKAVGQIVSQYGVQEFHLSFTKGRWDDAWGQSILAAPPGAELSAWFDASVSDVDINWLHVSASLSGLFCASLGAIPELTLPVLPTNIFSPSHAQTDARKYRYGSLPNEIVCTENITPWLKLLPCRSMEGLASLLQPLSIYSSIYHSIGTHFRPIQSSRLGSSFELLQTLTVVFSTSVSRAPLYESALRRHFNNLAPTACRSALVSNVYIEKENEFSSAIRIGFEPTRTDAKYHITDLKHGTQPQISLTWSDPFPQPAKSDVLHVDRYELSSGHERGSMVCTLTNPSVSSALEVQTYEAYPSLVALYIHTMRFHIGKEELVDTPRHIVKELHFTPSDLANSGKKTFSVLTMRILLPPNTSLSYIIDFHKNILHWTEYPPDAHRGFNIPSGIFSYVSDSVRARSLDWSPALHPAGSSTLPPQRIYTDELLVVLPTPDFSMPYNVICLSSTMVAFFFGSMLKMLTRRYAPLKEGKPVLSQRPIPRLLRAIGKWFTDQE